MSRNSEGWRARQDEWVARQERERREQQAAAIEREQCVVCCHPDRIAINAAMRSGESLGAIVERFAASQTSTWGSL